MSKNTKGRMSFLVVIFLLVLIGCSRDPKDFRITEQNKEKFWEEIKDMKGLTVEETRLLYAYILRTKIGQAFGSAAAEVVGKTVGELIAEQRDIETKAKREQDEQDRLAAEARAKQEAIADELRKSITLTVYDKSFIGSDAMAGRYEDYIIIRCAYQNNNAKDIRAFTGIVQFTDLFGKKIFESNLTVSDPISAGKKSSWNGQIKYNQFKDDHQTLRNTALADMKIIWLPSQILFADGSKIGVE